MSPKETIRSTSFQEVSLYLPTCTTYRNSNTILNKLNLPKISVNTIKDSVTKYGVEINNAIERDTNEILNKNDFDQTGKPKDIEYWRERCKTESPQKISKKELEKEVKKLYLKKYNTYDKTEIAESISELLCIERNRSDCVYISIDEVCVKNQKIKRKQQSTTNQSIAKNNPKHKKKIIKENNKRRSSKQKDSCKYARDLNENYKTDGLIYTPIAHVAWDDNKVILTGKGLKVLVKQITALLLKNQLLTTKQIVFLVDGAKNLKNIIELRYSYTNFTIVLDWYHAEKNIRTSLNSGLRCKEEDKEKYVNKVISKLWNGDINGVKKELNRLFDNKIISSKAKIEEIEGYLNRKKDHLTHYHLRKEKGLPNSSNAVEKANDIVVSNRQKHKGSSWTAKGSHTLSLVKVASCNDKLHEFIENPNKVNWFMPTKIKTSTNLHYNVSEL